MNDDLGGLPSRTVLSEGSLTPFCLPHRSPWPVAPQGLELAGAPRRVDALVRNWTILLTPKK